jgi:hypothetical protein
MSTLNEKKPAVEPMPVVHYDATGKPVPPWPPPLELRKLPRPMQQAILAASAELAEHEYRTNKDLTDFEAFAEEP